MINIAQVKNAIAIIQEACQERGGVGSRQYTSQSLNIRNSDGVPFTHAHQNIYTLSFQDYELEQVVSVSIVVTHK